MKMFRVIFRVLVFSVMCLCFLLCDSLCGLSTLYYSACIKRFGLDHKQCDKNSIENVVFCKRNKFIQVFNDMRMSKRWVLYFKLLTKLHRTHAGDGCVG